MDFLDELAAYIPVPAGGAAAAYTATLGVGLVHKVVLFELNRRELDPAPQANLRVVQKGVERLYLDPKKTVKEDPQYCLKYSECAKSGDRAEMKSAFLDIVTCSLIVMQKSFEGLDWVGRLSKISSGKLAPNLRVAAELLAAALTATAHLVRENIKPIKSGEKQQSYLRRLEELHDQGMLKKREGMAAM